MRRISRRRRAALLTASAVAATLVLTGQTATAPTASASPTTVAGYTAVSTSLDSSDRPWVLWRSSDGSVGVSRYSADGTAAQENDVLPTTPGQAVDLSIGPDDRPRVLWRLSTGAARIQTVAATGAVTLHDSGPYANDVPVAIGHDGGGHLRLLWDESPAHTAYVWTMDADGATLLGYGGIPSPSSGSAPVDLAVGADSRPRLLWNGGSTSLVMTLNVAGTAIDSPNRAYGPFGGFAGANSIAVGGTASQQHVYLTWPTTGSVRLWTMSADAGTVTSNIQLPTWTSSSAAGLAAGTADAPRVLWSRDDPTNPLIGHEASLAQYTASGSLVGRRSVTPDGQHWLTAWERPTGSSLAISPVSSVTCRFPARIDAAGNVVRVRLSNLYGTSAVSVGAAAIGGLAAAGGVVPGTSHPLTVGGSATFSIPAGVEVVSDPISISVARGDRFQLSIYLPGTVDHIPYHLINSATAYCGSGNHTADTTAAFAGATDTYVGWFSGIEVVAPVARTAAVAFGDSITDGALATNDTFGSWPDQLGAQLGATDLAVVNAGIGGNTIAAAPGTPPSIVAYEATTGVDRFARDALQRPGVSAVVVMEGTNDLCWGGSVASVESALTSVVAAAHAAGARAAVGTLVDRGGVPGGNICGSSVTDAQHTSWRASINGWIRSGGAAADALIDFEAAVQNQDPHYEPGVAGSSGTYPNYQDWMAAAFDGDHTHPNNAGYLAMANAAHASGFFAG